MALDIAICPWLKLTLFKIDNCAKIYRKLPRLRSILFPSGASNIPPPLRERVVCQPVFLHHSFSQAANTYALYSQRQAQ